MRNTRSSLPPLSPQPPNQLFSKFLPSSYTNCSQICFPAIRFDFQQSCNEMPKAVVVTESTDSGEGIAITAAAWILATPYAMALPVILKFIATFTHVVTMLISLFVLISSVVAPFCIIIYGEESVSPAVYQFAKVWRLAAGIVYIVHIKNDLLHFWRKKD